MLPEFNEQTFAWDPAAQRLRSKFGMCRVSDVAIELNRANTNPQAAFANNRFAEGPSFWWATAETMRFALLWSLESSADSKLLLPRQPPLSQLIAEATDLAARVPDTRGEVLEKSGLADFLYTLFSPQLLAARSSPLRPGQAVHFFDASIRRRQERLGKATFDGDALRAAIEDVLELSVRDLVRIVSLIYGRSMSGDPRLHSALWIDAPDAEKFGVLSREGAGVLRSRVERVIALMSADVPGMRAWMTDAAGSGTELALARSPNPVREFPLLRPFKDQPSFAIAPVPAFVLEWLYEPLMRLIRERISARFRDGLAKAFEEYVGWILDEHASGKRWVTESDFRLASRECRCVDFARQFGRNVVLVDAKRTYVPPEATVRLLDQDWLVPEQRLVEGVVQAAAFWRDVRAGRTVSSEISRESSPILILVTESDSRYFGRSERTRRLLAEHPDARAAGMEVAMVSLDELHWLASNWLRNDDAWLVGQLRALVGPRSSLWWPNGGLHRGPAFDLALRALLHSD